MEPTVLLKIFDYGLSAVIILALVTAGRTYLPEFRKLVAELGRLADSFEELGERIGSAEQRLARVENKVEDISATVDDIKDELKPRPARRAARGAHADA